VCARARNVKSHTHTHTHREGGERERETAYISNISISSKELYYGI